MLYERLLDLAPDMRLERRLAERVAARLAVWMLLAIPLSVVAATLLLSGIVHATLRRICEAGLATGAGIRQGLDGLSAPLRLP